MGLENTEGFPQHQGEDDSDLNSRTNSEKLEHIEATLNALEKKFSDRWILPVSLAFFSAILTFGNYFVQRLFINSDVYKNESTKTVAQNEAKNTSDFYQKCYHQLDSINKGFEAYCKIGQSQLEDSLITAKLIQLTSLIDHQFPIDPGVKRRIQLYVDYVSNKLMDFQSMTVSKEILVAAYGKNKIVLDSAITEINAAYLDITR